jgi:chorismate mutase
MIQILEARWALLVIFAICGIHPARAQNAVDKLQPLVETSARRLALAKLVALEKWDRQSPVEDSAREAQVIMVAEREGESMGLNRTFVAQFFKAQIEANKVVQYSLLADWRRAGAPPAHVAIDLVSAIRPELDRLEKELIGELADTVALRAAPACPADTAKAVGRYLARHRHDGGSLQAIALDRAMATNCTP